MNRSAAVLITVIITLFSGNGPSTVIADFSDRVLQTSSGTAHGLGQILPDLKNTPLIFMGEQHNDTLHHDLQLRILRTLNNLGIPLAVGLEMFTARDQDHLDSWVQGILPEEEFIKIHEKNWGDTWMLYRSIYRYARDNGIPLLGLNVPEEITTQVARKGFSSLSPEQRSELPVISCNVDKEYSSFIKLAMSVHNLPDGSREFERFCEAQLIWDTAMAYTLVRYLERNPDVTLLVLAGNSHSWRPGIPDQLSRFADGIKYRIILPEVPPVQTRHSIGQNVADYLWLLE